MLVWGRPKGRRRRARIHALRGGDQGFTLIEVVIAMAAVSVLVSASLGVLVRAQKSAADNNARVVAASLASGYIETARTQPVASTLASPSTTSRTVNGRAYTITRTALYTSDSGTVTTTCSSTSTALTSVLITASVTWTNMQRTTKPVRADTVKSVGSTGAIAVSVTGASGQPVSGIGVNLDSGTTGTTGTAGSATTDSNGCAVFVGLPVGPYTVTVDQTNYVGPDGTQQVSTPATVNPLEVTKVPISYDKGVFLNVRYTNANNTSTLTSSGASVLPDTFKTGAALTAAGGGTTGTIPGNLGPLWPSSYTAKAGPAAACTLGTADLSAGAPATATLDVPTALIQVDGISTLTGIGDIYAISKGGGACPVGTTFNIGTAILFFTSHQVTLPIGNWQIKLPNNVLSFIPFFTTTLTALGLGGLAYFCITKNLIASSLSATLINLLDIANVILSNPFAFLSNGGCT